MFVLFYRYVYAGIYCFMSSWVRVASSPYLQSGRVVPVVGAGDTCIIPLSMA